MERKLRKIRALLGVLGALALYVFLHEGGHCLVAILCGARITEFNLLGAYMSYTGGAFTDLSLAALHLMGGLLPYLLAMLLALLYPKIRGRGLGFSLFSLAFCAGAAGSFFAWAVVPLLYLAGKAPAGEDATKFLEVSGLPPLAVALGTLVLVLGAFGLMVRNQIPQTVYQQLKAVKEAQGQ